ncbi:MAG: PIN domain-containing protein [Candidatus Latescibacteria bacterium]|nr:PIN domain-containing protein [Candidatus Latescibacterota bacterium]
MKAFFDASALAKRYLEEPGSEQMEALCRQSTALAISALCLPEMISTLCRLRREGVLTPNRYASAKQGILEDLTDATICDITPSVIAQAIRLLETNVLRAMDALHIGCALEWEAEVFVSSDHRQLVAAQKAGLRVLNV